MDELLKVPACCDDKPGIYAFCVRQNQHEYKRTRITWRRVRIVWQPSYTSKVYTLREILLTTSGK